MLSRHTLTNGLPVLLHQNHSLPLTTLDMWVRVGGADEPAELAGISHFLEHMLFKGTPRLAAGQYDRRIEGCGGYLNAGTSQDYTHYYIEIPSDQLRTALTDFADVLCHSAILDPEVEQERHVILEEIRRKEDMPTGFLYDQVVRASFSEGPYASPVIGYPETVSAFKAAAIRDHYRRFYTADNMVLVVTGAVSPEELLPLLEELFATLPTTRRPHFPEHPRARYQLPQRQVWKRDWKEAYFYLTFPGPAALTLEDCVRNDFCETILSSGRMSRLVHSLREKQHLVTQIGAHFPQNCHDAIYLVGGVTEPARLEAARNGIIEEAERLVADGLRPGEEERARRQIMNGHIFATQTNSGVAGMLGYSEMILRSPALLTEYRDLVRDYPAERAVDFIGTVIQRGRGSFFVTQGSQESAAQDLN